MIATEIDQNTIPQVMRDARQWVNWRNPTKVPICPGTGWEAKTSDDKTWASLKDALASGHGDGIGYVFVPDDGLVGVDLDKCRNAETGEIQPWAQQVIDELDSYTEASPSGKGVHIIIQATMPGERCRKGNFECYTKGRYFTVTANRIDGTPPDVEERQEAFERVYWRVFEKSQAKPKPKPTPSGNGFDDDELIRKMMNARNGHNIATLWGGDISQHVNDHSLADDALCVHLVFWTGGDATRIDRLFRQSKLMRPKWDEQRGEQTYGERTIADALQKQTTFYSPRAGNGKQPKAEPQAGPVLVCAADIVPKKILWLWENWLAQGKMTVLAGDAGCGKSFVALDIAARLSAGVGWPDQRDGENAAGDIIILSAEDGVADTIIPRLISAKADRSRISILQGVRYPDDDDRIAPFDLDTGIRHLETAIASVADPKLIIIDPVSSYTGPNADSHKNSDVRRVLMPLCHLADRTGVAVLAINHLNKNSSMAAAYRTIGSVAFVAAARLSAFIGTDPTDPARKVLVPGKMNIGIQPDALAFNIDRRGYVSWSEDSPDVTADEVLKSPTHATKRVDLAADWLRERLKNGAVAAKVISAEAEVRQHSWRTIERAKNVLRVVCRPVVDEDGQRKWIWELPE